MNLLLWVLLPILSISFNFVRLQGPQVNFYPIFIKHFNNTLTQVLNQTVGVIEEECTNAFSKYTTDKNVSDFYFFKLLKDSSKNKNEVGSFVDCKTNKYGKSVSLKDFTYLIVYLRTEDWVNRTDLRYEENSYIIGLCIVDHCNDKDYQEVLRRFNSGFKNPLGLTDNTYLTVYNVNSYHQNMKNESLTIILICMIPFYFLVLQFIFICRPKFPTMIFRNCFKSKNVEIFPSEESNSSDRLVGSSSMGGSTNHINNLPNNNILTQPNLMMRDESVRRTRITVNKTLLFTFKSSFSLAKNGEELFTHKHTTFNNDSGLSYIRGMKGFSMILLVVGLGFFNLYNSTLKVYESSSFYNFMRQPVFSIIFYGLRYAPRILFSCSGFNFIYKFFCYLDERSTVEYKVNVSYSALLKFLAGQLYKYLIYVWVLFFFKYSFIYIFTLLSEASPMWIFFKINVIDEITLKSVLGHTFLYESFNFYDECKVYVFWLITNEIVFLLFSSFVVFIAYKKNYRMDVFFMVLFVLLITFRYLYCRVLFMLTPTLFYYFDNYGSFFVNPIYNYSFYLIGMFFGAINYTIQKGIRRKDTIDLKKSYLMIITKYTKTLKRKSKALNMTIIILSCLIITLLSCFVPLAMLFYNLDCYLSDYFLNPIINLWLLIDTEIVVILCHYSAIHTYLMGQSLLFKFITNTFWMSMSRMYFSFIIVINPVILYIFYQSESRITLDYFNLIFFSMVNYVVILFIAGIVYIVVELPFKRITKMALNEDGYDSNLS